MFRKIVKFEEHGSKKNFQEPYYTVWFEGVEGFSYLSKNAFVVAQLEDRLMREVDSKHFQLLEDFREAVYTQAYEEASDSSDMV